MADIGRSTAAHESRDTQSGRNLERLLRNWGNWVSCIPQPGSLEITLPPMFKDYVAGYRISTDGRTPENVDKAERLDRVLTTLADRDKACLILHYVMKLSDKKASSFLKRYDEANGYKDKYTCSDKTYASWLTIAENNAETKIMFAEGIDLDREPVYGLRKVLRRSA